MTQPRRPLTAEESALLDQLATSGLTLGQLAAREPSRARQLRNTAARVVRALGARTLDHALQIHHTQEQP